MRDYLARRVRGEMDCSGAVSLRSRGEGDFIARGCDRLRRYHCQSVSIFDIACDVEGETRFPTIEGGFEQATCIAPEPTRPTLTLSILGADDAGGGWLQVTDWPAHATPSPQQYLGAQRAALEDCFAGPRGAMGMLHLRYDGAGRLTTERYVGMDEARARCAAATFEPLIAHHEGLDVWLGVGATKPGRPTWANLERLTPDAIAAVVRDREWELRGCYEEAMASLAASEGSVRAKLLIMPTGEVATATVTENGFGHCPFERCLRGMMERWTFPTSSMRSVVQVPFAFRPEVTKGR